MKRTLVATTLTIIYAAAAVFSSPATTTKAQTRNQTSRIIASETFTFPNECTGELMDVADTTTVVCHDQQKADGTFDEKCQIDQDVTAVGETSGITFHGEATFKTEFTASDNCNFVFTNKGRVNLISRGSDVNLILTFDELVKKENCVLTTDSHMHTADCRGSGR